MLSKQEIEQVIINLITNAFHAMEEVTDSRKFVLKISARHVSDHVIIEVTDNGCGMDDKVLNSVFNPFYSTKDIGKGTGLGLSVSHGIIEHHRGTIKVKSTLGKGSTFTINLPVNPKKEERRNKMSKSHEDLRNEDKLKLD